MHGNDVTDGIGRSPFREVPFADRSVPRLLQLQAGRLADKPLLRTETEEFSYEEVRSSAARFAAILQAASVQAGDRVAILSENRPEFLQTLLGCAWFGAIAVPLNTALRGETLRHQLENSGARLVVVSSELLGRLTELDLPDSLEQAWTLDPLPEQVPAGLRVLEIPPLGDEAEAVDIDPSAIAAIVYTSGTTGPAKGVACSHSHLYWWGVIVSEQLGVTDDDVLYTCLPMFHINAMTGLFQAMSAGATFFAGPRFSASRFWRRLSDSGATVTYLLGAIVSILDSRPAGANDDTHRVRVALAPGSSAEVAARFTEQFGVTLVDGYGSTETNGVLGAGPGQEKAGWMGKVRDGFEARVVDAHDQAVPHGTVGELVIRADAPYSLASGYWGNPSATVDAWRNLWFHTGDAVVRSEDGWYRFVDRMKDTIRRRGENISSFDVEQAVGRHPAVSSVAAFAVPSDLGEDEVAIAVILDGAVPLPPEELIAWCESRLPAYAVPRYVRFSESFPRTANGKVRKSVLRSEGVADAWDALAAWEGSR